MLTILTSRPVGFLVLVALAVAVAAATPRIAVAQQAQGPRYWVQGGGGLEARSGEFALNLAAAGVGRRAGFEAGAHIFPSDLATVSDVYFDVLFRADRESRVEAYPMIGLGFVNVSLAGASSNTFEFNLGLQVKYWAESNLGVGGRLQWFKSTLEGDEGRWVLVGTVAYSFR